MSASPSSRPPRRRLRRALAAAVAFGAAASVLVAPGTIRPASAVDAGIIVTIAGRRSTGVTPPAAPRATAVDHQGNVFFTDTDHHKIRRIDPSGAVTDIAGTGQAGQGGDGGPALQAQLNTPHGVAVDNRGHVFIADSPNHRIRRVDLASGIITTVAGTGTPGFSGDGGPATAARLDRPRSLIFAPDGSMIIADTDNRRVRKVTTDGIITTIAGNGQTGYSGDGGRATGAKLDDPRGLALDAAGNLYVSNAEGSPNPTVRRIDPAGIITTFAGGKPAGYSGDGGPATAARLNEPRSLAISGRSLYIADSLNHRVRRVNLDTNVIDTVAGTGVGGFGGDSGPAVRARLAEPRGVAVTDSGDVVVADTGNNRIRLIGLPPGSGAPTPPPPVAQVTGVVYDRAARPVDGAVVDVFDGAGDHLTAVRTGGDGAFAVGLDDGSYRLVASSPSGCAPLVSGPVPVTASGTTADPRSVTFRLSEAPDGPVSARTDTAQVQPGADGTASVRLDTAVGDVNLRFTGVTRSGSVTARCQAEAPAVPSGFRLVDRPLELSGTNVAFQRVNVCVPYTPAQAAGLDESGFELMQLPGGELITTSRGSGKVCGDSDRLAGVSVAIRAPISVGSAGATRAATGYRLVAADGGIFAFGDAGFFGSTGAMKLNQPIVGGATTRSGRGYWLVAADGGIFAFGDAGFFGSTGNIRLNQPIVGMSPTPSGRGYWLVASDGGIFAFGDARFFGSTGDIRLAKPIVGMAVTPTGSGYWMVASDGGLFAFGDAAFAGSGAALRPARTFVGMAASATGAGYWLVSSDGGVFRFGDAGPFGSADAAPLNRPIVGMAATPSGQGYWLAASDGGIFAFGDAGFLGSTGAIRLNQPIAGLVAPR